MAVPENWESKQKYLSQGDTSSSMDKAFSVSMLLAELLNNN